VKNNYCREAKHINIVLGSKKAALLQLFFYKNRLY